MRTDAMISATIFFTTTVPKMIAKRTKNINENRNDDRYNHDYDNYGTNDEKTYNTFSRMTRMTISGFIIYENNNMSIIFTKIQ